MTDKQFLHFITITRHKLLRATNNIQYISSVSVLFSGRVTFYRDRNFFLR